MSDVRAAADARWHDLHERLDSIEQCAREEFGGTTRTALVVTLIGVVRGLMHEVDTLRADRALDDAHALRPVAPRPVVRTRLHLDESDVAPV